jgi:uncharacterized protein (DUF362 family)
VKDKNKPIQKPEYVKTPLSRRAFIARSGTALGVTTAAGYLALAPEDWPGSLRDKTGLRSKPSITPLTIRDYRVARPAMSKDVGIGRGDTVQVRLRKALDLVGGLQHYVKPGDIVMVKPNVAFDRSPNLGATTNPEVLEELIRMLLVDCRAQEVRVADNPIESPSDCFIKSGIKLATERAGGRVYLPDSNAFKMLHTPGARLIENWWFFHRPLTNVDKVIGVTPVKDHNLCNASLGIKNWYGLLGGRRNQFHQDIHTIVADLSVMLKPTLTIVDGSHILMKNGPTGGDPSDVKPGNTIVTGTDPVAIDAWAFEHLLGRGKDYPQYLFNAEKRGSGRLNFEGRIGESA